MRRKTYIYDPVRYAPYPLSIRVDIKLIQFDPISIHSVRLSFSNLKNNEKQKLIKISYMWMGNTCIS